MKIKRPTASESSLPADDKPSNRRVPADAAIELFYSLLDPVLLVTPEGKIREVNGALLQATGKSRGDVIGSGVCDIIHGGRWPHIKCPLEEYLLTFSAKTEHSRLPGLGGEYLLSVIPVRTENTKEQTQILLVARRLTKDEIYKVDSIRTAQLAAIGELAAGVAHEVNNPINGIINFAQLLLDDCSKQTEQAALLEKIVGEGERIAAIIYNLLSFSRENNNDFKMVDLNEVIRDSLSLVEHQLKRDGISLFTAYYEPSCLVVGNFSQLQQVVLNLISNSRYALNERYRGTSSNKRLEISLDRIERDNRIWFRMTVRDNGTGIPQGILEKLFEPFFTSKPAGQGSGLGLSISYGIVSNHQGRLRVDSILNRYTAMMVEIPALE